MLWALGSHRRFWSRQWPATWRVGNQASGVGKGWLIHLLLRVHLTAWDFPPRRECVWRHPGAAPLPIPREAQPVHSTRLPCPSGRQHQQQCPRGYSRTDHQTKVCCKTGIISSHIQLRYEMEGNGHFQRAYCVLGPLSPTAPQLLEVSISVPT